MQPARHPLPAHLPDDPRARRRPHLQRRPCALPHDRGARQRCAAACRRGTHHQAPVLHQPGFLPDAQGVRGLLPVAIHHQQGRRLPGLPPQRRVLQQLPPHAPPGGGGVGARAQHRQVPAEELPRGAHARQQLRRGQHGHLQRRGAALQGLPPRHRVRQPPQLPALPPLPLGGGLRRVLGVWHRGLRVGGGRGRAHAPDQVPRGLRPRAQRQPHPGPVRQVPKGQVSVRGRRVESWARYPQPRVARRRCRRPGVPPVRGRSGLCGGQRHLPAAGVLGTLRGWRQLPAAGGGERDRGGQRLQDPGVPVQRDSVHGQLDVLLPVPQQLHVRPGAVRPRVRAVPPELGRGHGCVLLLQRRPGQRRAHRRVGGGHHRHAAAVAGHLLASPHHRRQD
mmetsp:Transcript_59791/g.144061  ORF Transcript_59791/g.144061 Transcript_59791/m.144061 type:complete len:392 (+) Transcript_59791:564-1739(+)